MKKKVRKPKTVVDLDNLGLESGEVDSEEIADLFNIDPLIFRPPGEIALSMSMSMKEGNPYVIPISNPKMLSTIRRMLLPDLQKIGYPNYHARCQEDHSDGTTLTFTYTKIGKH